MGYRTSYHDPQIVGSPIRHYLRFCVYLFVFWLLITQNLSVKFLCMGAVGALAVAWVCMPLFLIQNLSHTKRYFMLDIPLIPLIDYFIWLLKELILANLDVAKTVWKKELPIRPKLIVFHVTFDNPIALSLLANSITLTPGTITLKVNRENEFYIHALTPAAAEGICAGSMAKKIAALFHEDATVTMIRK